VERISREVGGVGWSVCGEQFQIAGAIYSFNYVKCPSITNNNALTDIYILIGEGVLPPDGCVRLCDLVSVPGVDSLREESLELSEHMREN